MQCALPERLRASISNVHSEALLAAFSTAHEVPDDQCRNHFGGLMSRVAMSREAS